MKAFHQYQGGNSDVDVVTARRRAVIITLVVIVGMVLFFALTTNTGANPPPSPPNPDADPVGVCCLGAGRVAYDVPRSEHDIHQFGSDSHPWIMGEFDQTDDETPCDLVPGGD